MDNRLAFLGIFGSATGPTGLRGGAMVTDETGIPLELRVAETIRPNLLQRHAYGETLHSYAILDLITVPLLSELQLRPQFTFANNLTCLDAKTEVPIVLLTRPESLEITEGYRITHTTAQANGQHLAIVCQPSEDSTIIQAAVETIGRTQQLFDPLAVFHRIEGVIEMLAEHDDHAH